jgi:hypothetical protein
MAHASIIASRRTDESPLATLGCADRMAQRTQPIEWDTSGLHDVSTADGPEYGSEGETASAFSCHMRQTIISMHGSVQPIQPLARIHE